MTTASLALNQLDEKLQVTGWRGETRDAKCPAHNDTKASLVYGPGDNGGTVMMCHAGCSTEAILDAIGMNFTDLSPDPHIVDTYTYLDEDGQYLWHVERWIPKDFRIRPGLPPPANRRLYRSELLPEARKLGQPVYIVEGEKDVNSLLDVGVIAVCGVGGAGNWLPGYSDQLTGLDVHILVDSDEVGRAHGRHVAHALDGKARSVFLSETSYGKDISDQLAAGYDLATVVPLPVDETLGIHRADRIQEREVEWLWPGYFPAGKLVIIEGDPGDGKSVMSCDLAARFSTGARMPDGSRCTEGPIDVVMVSAEDDPADTIRPRLRVAGANLTRIHLITEGSIPGSPFDLGRDVPALEHFVRENNIKIVFIDPLMAFMPANVNTNSDHEVRRALHPLIRMSMRTGCTLVVIRHLTKGRTKAITAGGGSIAFIGAARVGFLVGPHPDDETRRVLGCIKINVGEKPATLGYAVRPDKFNPKLPRVIWDDDPIALSAQEILDHEDDTGEGRGTRDDAKLWLDQELKIAESGLSWKEIVGAGRVDGHSEATLRRVRNTVSRAERNPMTKDGWKRTGTFWYHRDAPPPPTDEPLDDEPEAPVVALMASVTGFCDVCDAEPAIFFKTEGVNRCSIHNPRLWEASA